MTKDEAIDQLKSLIDDRESFLKGDEEEDDIYLADIEAIKIAVEVMEGTL